MENFFSRIDDLLAEKGMTQKTLAEHLGLSSSQIYSNWKARNSIPSADVALKIADYLHTSVEYLVNGDTTAKNKQVKDRQSKAIQKDLEKILSAAGSALDKIKNGI